MKVTSHQRSRIMRTSWEIQRSKKQSRAKSLLAAWTIYQHEDVIVFQLVRRRRIARTAPVALQHPTLFD